MSNVEDMLEKICTEGRERIVKSDRGVYSYLIRLCPDGGYSFSLESIDAAYTRTCGSAVSLHRALVAAMENMGEDDPEMVVDAFMEKLAAEN